MKFISLLLKQVLLISRSRKGAWIEISLIGGALSNSAGRSRKGAWIEIGAAIEHKVDPAGRSRKGAWIEISRF